MSAHHELQVVEAIFVLLFGLLLVFYIVAVKLANRSYKKWPLYRTVCWCISMFCAMLSLAGPLAKVAHEDFTLHMVNHLLLGMLAPLLMAMSAPITLLLRAVSTRQARMLVKVLKSWPLRIVTNPLTATFLNVGGLWLLYKTNLYMLLHENSLIYFIVHMHFLLAGYVFTVSLIAFDLLFHRTSFLYRAIVLIFALAGHGILAKNLYAHPPDGVSIEQAQQGSILMYYGGDLIDAVIIFILCMQWYKATRPRTSMSHHNEIDIESS